jgi:hypothetical protein
MADENLELIRWAQTQGILDHIQGPANHCALCGANATWRFNIGLGRKMFCSDCAAPQIEALKSAGDLYS